MARTWLRLFAGATLSLTPLEGPEGVFDGTLLADETYSHTFSRIGEFPYYCTEHPWQTGLVSVQGIPADLDTTPPMLTTPEDIVVDAEGASGKRVDYFVRALDEADGLISSYCAPQSGTFFPIGETTVSCSATDESGNSDYISFVVTVMSSDIVIPDWIRDVAGFWCADGIDDAAFIEAIQHLIINEVIQVPATPSELTPTSAIPPWIKNNACWWSKGEITNNDFAAGLQHLIVQGIIQL